ncbi:D-tyrosyl-tRNA(Tyr) deacylase [Desulfofundulus sp. TPOSR]|jgi:D-tyrosyl-tRNA(Tyr) deacylase|uniref:D-aminoacyl-tRNA deacylase n=1 Tax=Desulfofundulus kuznetsovii (strain DSM 6115 / VKM B-1805 / 17) TaxID=760568 RepID=A0AAU8PU97_DESK7|nr:D-aminoacyl-tRNA deacylase [Desulfofundulus sp. TPOSR]AEG15611.1 D-tyrosyl-tRNA(Tyr) deacylase [Desulfofundulus kuznetsovii DSM 6115]NHM27725.1 D-tyrosyl-tRNA(Tyr) deacylase [Desulfofundulus sp. TPOSR]
MRAVVQRVARGSVTVDGERVAVIGPGLVVLLGVGREDDAGDARYLAQKVARLRIFEDEQGKMNRSVLDTGGEVLVVSQFTLFGDCRQGRRPGFDRAARPEQARELYELFVRLLREEGLAVATGVFGAYMQVEIINDGPVTMLLDSKKEF